MNKVNDGGPAFPSTTKEHRHGYQGEGLPDKWTEELHYEGMSLRVYIAIHAPAEEIAIMGFSYSSGTYLEELCAARYRYADQMLKAREPKKDGE